MLISYSLLAGLLAVAPSAMAASCKAQAFHNNGTFEITTGDHSIFEWTKEDGKTLCDDNLFQTFDPANLKQTQGKSSLAAPFVWKVQCAGGSRITSCNGTYLSQKGLKGQTFTGMNHGGEEGVGVGSCTIKFDC
ncbi:uncharacterized protein N7459_007958 [Penicillium hispanicum]|uniref:uncharacterized protein n=1 Tax=Penicillium hispanicum TaxID=1080232 RepID=UPI00253F8A88|nr:uncharacterized protein N7459_007958 [Penicillium hispanicum]KAJ5573531.1 hypothetical protein N7459_007958 [Penicillium hispanicum]